MPKASLLSRAAALSAAVVLLSSGPARAAAGGEQTPLNLGGSATSHAAHVGGGGSIVRTIVGLAIVIGVIYGVAWVLKQVKAGKQERSTGTGLATVASVPLGSGRSVQLVRAGRDFVLVGVAEHGVAPLRNYDEAQARAAGLIDADGELLLPAEPASSVPIVARRLPRLGALPKPRLALPASTTTSPRPGGQGPLAALRAMTVRR
jgi:flagellar protein FliO/FliZ